MPMTLGLQNMRRQTDAAFPGRDKTSDGGIGDEPHRLRKSGHNPDDTAGSKPTWDGDPDNLPEWRAWDMDSQLRAPGVTTQQWVDHVRRLPGLGGVLRFIIYNRKIYHAPDFAPADYSGDDPHIEHVHLEGAYTQAADNNTTFNFRFEEIPVALTDTDKTWLADKIDKAATAAAERVWATRIADPYDNDGSRRELAAGTWLAYVPSRGQVTDTRNAIIAAVDKLTPRPTQA